jgi:hypothetical protein
MAKYVLLFYGGGSMPETPEEQAAVLQQWTVWYDGLGAGVVDGGNPTSGAAKTVGPDGTATNGGVGEAPSGYAILEAESLDAATDMSKSCPIITGGGRIAVYETFNVM